LLLLLLLLLVLFLWGPASALHFPEQTNEPKPLARHTCGVPGVWKYMPSAVAKRDAFIVKTQSIGTP
jgi:hypothetical protein